MFEFRLRPLSGGRFAGSPNEELLIANFHYGFCANILAILAENYAFWLIY